MSVAGGPGYVGHSTEANHPQSATLAQPKRRPILRASSPSLPMTRVPGEVKNDGLLLGCIQASTPVPRSVRRNTHALVGVQRHDQSFVSSLDSFHSSSLIQTYISRCSCELPLIQEDAILIDISTLTDFNKDSTVVPEISFNADQNNNRSLTQSMDVGCKTMDMATISAPGSPPELTESRSSKSSTSSYDSHFSTKNDLSTEITNFEDIGLEDDNKSEDGRREQGGHSAREVLNGGSKSVHHTPRRPTLSKIDSQQRNRNAEGASRNAIYGNIKRGFTSPSTMTLSGQNSRPRSNSPPKLLPRSASTYSISRTGSIGGVSPGSSLAPSRRGSWQPQRKTIEEIEAEYHDSDDDLPEDASLWNVPISPYPATGISPRSSFKGSPDRSSAVRSPQPIPLDHSRSSPDHSRSASFSQPIPRHRLTPRSSSTNLSRSNPASPRMLGSIRNGRAKSWNLAMADLSAEAKIVSENLEYYADANSMSKSLKNEKIAANIAHRSSAPSAIQLPPIQKGPLDFMPVSKEKEAILSRTRPSWLPPKDPKEERRHLKEYQRMMAASIEAEKKRESKIKSTECQKDSTRESLNRIWDYYINPTTDITSIDRRVHDLCWRGISPRVRGKVWQRALGNSLGLTSNTYYKALERAQVIKAKNPEDLSQHERSISTWFVDIERDAETAFPELNVFQRNGPLWRELINICEAYACYRSDIGYVYGVQLVGGLLLLQLSDASEAFVLMANCFNRPIPLAFQTSDITSTQRAYHRVVSNLGVKFPRLHDYLFESIERGGLGLTGEEVFEPMFRTLFSNGLDLDHLCRVWDIWIFEGDRTLIRTAVAILGSLQSQIFDIAGDVHLKRRNVQEMLGWGPFNRDGKGSHWKFDSFGGENALVDEIESAGKLDYTGH